MGGSGEGPREASTESGPVAYEPGKADPLASARGIAWALAITAIAIAGGVLAAWIFAWMREGVGQ